MAADQQFHRRVAKLIVLRDRADAPDEFVSRMVHHTLTLENKIDKLNEKDTADVVIKLSADPQRRGDVAQGLVYLMLTAEKDHFQKYIQLLSQMGDNWFQALYTMNVVSIEMFHKLQEGPKDNFLNFFREAIRFNVPKLDSVIMNFVRTLNGAGDWSSRLRLLNEFAKIVADHQDWLFSSVKQGSLLFALMAITFGHFIADLPSDGLRSLLIEVFVLVVRKRSNDVILAGRDFVLTLMRISKIPAITQLWTDLLRKPAMFGVKSFEEVAFRTIVPPINGNRLSMDVAKKIMFLVENVKGQNSKHYEWFVNAHLKGPDALSMRAEMVRFVLNYLPQNVTPMVFDARMHFVYYLVTTAQHGHESAWIKANLWVDWLFYENNCPYFVLEPGLAVIRYSLSVQATKANSLLEYLVASVPTIHPPFAGRITAATNQAMKVMADFFSQNNQPPVSNILESMRLDKSVRDGIRNLFRDFVRAPPVVQSASSPSVIVSTSQSSPALLAGSSSAEKTPPVERKIRRREEVKEVKEAKDDGGEEKEKSPSPPTRVRKTMSKEEAVEDVESNYQMLREDIKPIVQDVKEKFNSEDADDSERSDSIGRLLQKLLDNDDSIDDDQLELIGQCLHGLIGRPQDNGKSLVPDQITEEAFQDSFNHPLYIIFRNLCFTPASDTTSRAPLVTIIAAMRDRDNYISLLLLFFIKYGVGTNSSMMSNNEYAQCYEEVARACDKDVAEMLADDLETMALEDDRLFSHMLPFVFEKFSNEIGNSPEVLHTVCSHIDAKQLNDLVGTMIREANSIFRKDNICNLVTASLDWHTTAQYTLWQMIHAEAVPIDWLLPVVPKVKPNKHGETSVNLLLTFRRLDREPGMSILRTIFARTPGKEDFFTINALRILIDDSDTCQKVGELLSSLIKKLINNNDFHMNNNSEKQKQQGKKPSPRLSLEQVLSHLELFTQFCLTKEKKIAEQLFSKWLVQDAFKSIKTCEKAAFLRPKYSQLFAVVEILADDNPQSSRTLRGNRGNNTSSPTPTKQQPPKRKETDDDDAPKSKKRPVYTVDSDSD